MIVPLPLTRDVTFAEDHAPRARRTPVTRAGPYQGAFANVIVLSPHVVLETGCTLTPIELVFVACSRNVARVTVPLRPAILKRRKPRSFGDTSALTDAEAP